MELADISNLGDSEPNFIFSDDGSTNKKCSCSRTWVLVVHNDFLQVDGYERKGNDVDVENLRRVWKQERQCKFAELANCTSAQIIGTLSSGEKLSQLFHPRNSSDPDGILCEPPEVFLLFVLSHGESGGIILTDHLKPKQSEKKNFVLTLETYETCDVWNSLMDVHLLESCVKVLFFAPCRGTNPELRHDLLNKNFKDAADIPTSGFLASKPNHEDFIIFYATVETTFSNRNEIQGTWFVQSICSVLDSLAESEDILLFFTKVQNHMCQRTQIDCFKENIGQTPQLHLFAYKQIQFCASHVDLVPLHNKKNLSDYVTETDCRPSELNETIDRHAKDAKRSNFASELIKADRAIFYNWGQEHHRYHRGSALIFHDDPHICQAFSIGESFKNLDYDVKIFSTCKIMTEIARKSLKMKLKYEGSLVLCVLAKLEETNAGLTLQMGKKCLLLSQIVDELSIIKCKHLIGKPKLIFIIDEGTKQDNSRPTPEVMEALQFSNSNAGVCLFVGTRACPDENLTDQLTSMLALEELKSGHLGLQFALANLIRQISSSDDDGNEQSIKPQLISTLPVLVDFPPLLKPYKPCLSTNKRIFLAAGITISVIIFALLVSLLRRSGDGKADFPSNFTQVHISDNCTVGFSDGNSDQVDAFTFNQSTWKALSEMCNETWKDKYPQEFISVSLSLASALERAVDHVKSAAPFTQRHVILVILFGYDTPGDLQHTLTFVSALTSYIARGLLVQSCIDIFHRVESFKQLNGIEMFIFWEIIQKEGLQAELNFTSQLNESHSAAIGNISNYIREPSNNEYRKLSVAFSKLDRSTKLLFMPQIISTCYRKNLIVRNLFEYIASMGNVACEGLKEVYLLISTDKKLAGSKTTLILREISEKINEELCKNVTKYILQLPYSQLQIAFEKFAENGNNLKELQAKSLNLADDALFTLIIDNYKGSAKNGARLAKFIWSVSDRADGFTSCICTFCFSLDLAKFKKENSLHALVLYTNMSKNKKVYIRDKNSICNSVIRSAPSIAQIYLFDNSGTNCSMDTNSPCLVNAINDINAILMEHGTSDDANVSYHTEVLFIGYVLHLLEEKALQSYANISKLFIVTDNKFKEIYDTLYDEVMIEYLFQNHTQSNIFKTLSLNKNLNKISFYEYFYHVVFKRAFAKFGLTVANSMIPRLDGILTRYRVNLGTVRIFCNFTTALYDEIGSNKSVIYSEEAFAVFIFLENYLEHYENLLKGNKSSNEFVKAYINKCSSVFGNLTESVQGKLDYFLQTWNVTNLQPELLKWHKKFQLSSAWLLPKLVQHVIKNNNSQNVLQLLDLFSVLRNESYSEPLGICPGLFELVQQMRLHPNSFDTVIKEKVRQTLPSKNDLRFNFTHVTESISYSSYWTYISKCNQSNHDFLVYSLN